MTPRTTRLIVAAPAPGQLPGGAFLVKLVLATGVPQYCHVPIVPDWLALTTGQGLRRFQKTRVADETGAFVYEEQA